MRAPFLLPHVLQGVRDDGPLTSSYQRTVSRTPSSKLHGASPKASMVRSIGVM